MKFLSQRIILIHFLSLLGIGLIAQNNNIQSGPMLGYADMKEVQLWVQTRQSATVVFEYWVKDKPNIKWKTIPIITKKESAFVAKPIADKVEPTTTYQYDLFIDNAKASFDFPTEFKTQTLWQWRTNPPNFKLAIGSCAFINDAPYDRPGRPYGGDYQIFESIRKTSPDLMLWLGDNVYYRESDYNTRTGMLYRNTQVRSLPELQKLLASTNHYAIWDDHDFGPNDSDRSYIYKDMAKDVFNLFWGNPSQEIPQTGGNTTTFQYNDIDFFLLDNRYNRAPNYRKTGDRSLLGKEQIEWLIDGLIKSRATYKMIAIGGQVLNTAAVYENYIANHSAEREMLLKRISDENIKGIVFLTGDRHHTEMDSYTNAAGNKVYDITISPLTSHAHGGTENEGNKHIMPGTLVEQRNFGILEFTGDIKNRQLTITVNDSDGKQLWTKKLSKEDL